MNNLDNDICYDHIAIEPLAKLGWQTLVIPWQQAKVNWSEYDVVVIRSTWDYQDNADEFINVLTVIDKSAAVLLNSLKTVQWNISKTYLKQLAQQGIAIVPTCWHHTFDLNKILNDITQLQHRYSCAEFIIKPCVSAGSFDTFRLSQQNIVEQSAQLMQCFNNRDFMLQPFVPDILAEGEYSLFFFNNQLSHSILKKPKSGDFRVQEEYGGHLSLITPDEALLDAAQKAISTIQDTPLYVRVDMVKYQGEYVLMELELIEPSLYFNIDPTAAQRFADALEKRYQTINEH